MMILKNKLGIKSEIELAKEEERISKLIAMERSPIKDTEELGE